MPPKDDTKKAAADEATEIRALKRKGQPGMGATSGGPLGDRIVRGGEVVREDELPKEKFEALMKDQGFDLMRVAKVLLVAMVIGLMSLAPVSAQADGTNFTYPHKIGWGGAFLDQLATVFGAIDTALTGVGTDLASTDNGEGASLVGVEDAGGFFGAVTDVEAALQAIGPTMTDARTPTAHAITHATGGGDAIAPADIGAATAADLDALEVRTVHVLAPVIASWDPTDIGGGVVDPPTSTTGDRYLASATEAPYVSQRIYEYDGSAWQETTGDNGDWFFHEDDNANVTFNGAMWLEVATTADIAVLDEKVAPYLQPVIAAWDPTGPADPPTSNDGDRYLASATDGSYTSTYIYEYDGSAWLEYIPSEADTTYNEDTDTQIVYDGAAWNAMGAGTGAADIVLADQARRSTATNQTTTTATPLKITFETSEVAGDVTYLSGDYTVPEDGVYAVAASLTFATSAGGTARNTYIYVDGVAFEDTDAAPDGSNPVTVAASAIAYLAASSVIAIYGEQDSGGDLDVTAGRVAVQRVQ